MIDYEQAMRFRTAIEGMLKIGNLSNEETLWYSAVLRTMNFVLRLDNRAPVMEKWA